MDETMRPTTESLTLRRIAAEALIGNGEPDATALAAARRHEGSIEAKVLLYADRLPDAAKARAAVARLRRILTLIVMAGLLLAFLAGAATLRTAFLGRDGFIVNFHWAVASLLGLDLIMLLVWLLALLLAHRHAGENSLGAGILGLWRMAVGRFSGGKSVNAGAARALLSRVAAARLWVVSSVSHGLWLSFLLGGLLMALILLSTHQYVFVWETTILDSRSYIALTKALAELPQAIGIATPGDAAIRAAQWQGAPLKPTADETLWSNLLIASLFLYGILPRLLLLGFSLLRLRALWHRPLDLTRPELAALVPHLAPVVEHTRIVSPAGPAAPLPQETALKPLAPPKGRVAVLGWEVDIGQQALDGLASFGTVDGRAELDAALARLAGPERPGRLLIAADLSATPDRGVTAGLRRLLGVVDDPVLLLTGQAALRRRLEPEAARDRLTDWVRAAHAAGLALERIVEIDLDAPEAEDITRLKALTGEAA